MLLDLLLLLLFLYFILGGISRVATAMREQREKADGLGGQALKDIERVKRASERVRRSTPVPVGRQPVLPPERVGRMQRVAQASRRLAVSPPDPERGPLGRLGTVRLTSDEGSLEQVHIEVVDRDEEAETIVQRRIQAAEKSWTAGEEPRAGREPSRSGPRPAKLSRPALTSMSQLRRALVWREILGPPVSLRD
jgi:hypothetical protein